MSEEAASPLESPGLYQGAENAPQSARDPHPVAAIRTKPAQFMAHTPDFRSAKKNFIN